MVMYPVYPQHIQDVTTPCFICDLAPPSMSDTCRMCDQVGGRRQARAALEHTLKSRTLGEKLEGARDPESTSEGKENRAELTQDSTCAIPSPHLSRSQNRSSNRFRMRELLPRHSG